MPLVLLEKHWLLFIDQECAQYHLESGKHAASIRERLLVNYTVWTRTARKFLDLSHKFFTGLRFFSAFSPAPCWFSFHERLRECSDSQWFLLSPRVVQSLLLRVDAGSVAPPSLDSYKVRTPASGRRSFVGIFGQVTESYVESDWRVWPLALFLEMSVCNQYS